MALSPLQKMSVTGAAALVVVGLFGAVSYYYASRLVAADRAVDRTNANMSAALRIVAGTKDGERAVKAYVVRPDSATRLLLRDAQAGVEDAIDAITRASEDNPRQLHLLSHLATQVAASFSDFRTTLALRDRVGADSARRFLMSGLPAAEADSLMRIVTQMREEELRVLAEKARQQSAHGTSAQRIILVGMALTFLLAGVALQPMRAEVAARITSHLARGETAAIPELAEEASARAAASSAQLHALHRIVAALADARDAEAGARALVDLGAPLLSPALAAVVIADGAGGYSVLAASDAAFARVDGDLVHALDEAMHTGETVLAESRAARERLCGSLPALDAHGARGAALFVPLANNGSAAGVLLAARAGDIMFGDDELTFAATLGRLGGPAVASRSLPS